MLVLALQVLANDDASSSSGDSDFGDKVKTSLQPMLAVALLPELWCNCTQLIHTYICSVRSVVLVDTRAKSCCWSLITGGDWRSSALLHSYSHNQNCSTASQLYTTPVPAKGCTSCASSYLLLALSWL